MTWQRALRDFLSHISDIGSNIGPHSLTVAAMEREVVVLDAVFYNLGKNYKVIFFCQNHFYPLYVKVKNLDISTFGTLTASFSPDLNEPQDDKQGEGEDPVQLHQ